MADEPKTDPPKVNGADGPLVIPLRKAVNGGDGTDVKELKFREPTAGDIERCGNPVLIDLMTSDTPKITFDAKSMTQMMATLAAVPPSSIRQMHPKDWNSAAWSLAGFFTPDL